MAKDKRKTVAPKSMLSGHAFLGDTAGCGHIRVIFPNILLFQHRHRNIQFLPSFNSQFIMDGNFYSNKRFIIFQRSATKAHLEIMKAIKGQVIPKLKHRMKLIYEIDDNLINIPQGNFAQKYYEQNRVYIEEMLRLMDGIVVSTPRLREELLPFNNNISVVKNRLPKFIGGEPPSIEESVDKENKKPKILGTGSSNHFAIPGLGYEGGDIKSTLMEYIRKTTDKYEGIFQGGIPNELRDLVKEGKMTGLPGQKVIEFPMFLKSMNIDVGIAPLEMNEFNECKSNIKALEYTAAGIPGIYSHIQPYFGLRNTCKTEEYMIDRIETLVSNREERKFTIEHDYDKLKEQLYGEEYDNLNKYVNAHLKLLGYKLPN